MRQRTGAAAILLTLFYNSIPDRIFKELINFKIKAIPDMKQHNTKILSNLIFKKFMSVYWSMYYLEKLGEEKRRDKKKSVSDKKENPLKLIIKDKSVSEKKK